MFGGNRKKISKLRVKDFNKDLTGPSGPVRLIRGHEIFAEGCILIPVPLI
jgi:hypothetical protein